MSKFLREKIQLILALMLICSVIGFSLAGTPHGHVKGASALSIPFVASIDTMKESRDTETFPLTFTQIADDVNLSSSLYANYITVDTHWDYPNYALSWVKAIRAAGKHVWFRMAPNQWENNNGVTGIMTPSAYESALQTFITSNPGLFQSGDIFDPCPEPENGHYWVSTYGSQWSWHAPNAATADFNQFIRTTSDVADSAFNQIGVHGVITSIRSTNSFFATHPEDLEQATVDKFGLITFDSYPESTTTDPATATNLRISEIQQVENTWHVPIVLGEVGYSNAVAVDDVTQESVVKAELQGIAALPYIIGMNYWVGAGTNNSGGYTHIFAGSNGNWSLRPAAADVASFYASQQPVVTSATPPITQTIPDITAPQSQLTLSPPITPSIKNKVETSTAIPPTISPSIVATILPSPQITEKPVQKVQLTGKKKAKIITKHNHKFTTVQDVQSFEESFLGNILHMIESVLTNGTK